MESMLPAQLGTHLDMPGGLKFKATKQQELRETAWPIVVPYPVVKAQQPSSLI